MNLRLRTAASSKEGASRAVAEATATAASKKEKVANLKEGFMVSKEWNPREKTNVGG